MKKSSYNMIFDFDRSVVIYNTFADSITCLKRDFWNKPDLYDSCCADESSLLHSQGIVVNEGIDESEVFRFRANRQKYCGKRTHIFLTITGACNCSCSYCFAAGSLPKKNMTVRELPLLCGFIEKQVLLNHSSLLVIDFFGGEPFLLEDFYLSAMDAITELAIRMEIKVEFQFYTNGTIMPKGGMSVFNKYPKVTLQITLDGFKAVHDSLRPLKKGGSSFDAIIANLHVLKNQPVYVKIRINYGLNSYKNIGALLEYLRNEGLACFPIDFYPVQSMSEGCADYSDAIPVRQLPEISLEIWKTAIKYGIKPALRAISGNCYCSAFTYSTFIINAEMDVFKCALLQCDRKHRIGNLLADTSLDRDSGYYRWMNYDPGAHEKCSRCISLPVCAGGCGGSGTHRYGDWTHPNCFDLSPIMLESKMKLYLAMCYDNRINNFGCSGRNMMVLEKAKHLVP